MDDILNFIDRYDGDRNQGISYRDLVLEMMKEGSKTATTDAQTLFLMMGVKKEGKVTINEIERKYKSITNQDILRVRLRAVERILEDSDCKSDKKFSFNEMINLFQSRDIEDADIFTKEIFSLLGKDKTGFITLDDCKKYFESL